MKKPDATTLGDLLKLGEAALSVLVGAGDEIKTQARGHRDDLVRKLDLVTREEFDAAFAMIKKARKMQDELDKRITALEKKKSLSSPQKRKSEKQIRAKK